ncbi:unnamed protein product [marine sediment metagenome]|uniref:Coenzyme PQQ synthesis protein D (PqqD) n=1 Tax=marine sediment metagenome TaxID=412755 RepID=X0UG72_9ZZZZ
MLEKNNKPKVKKMLIRKEGENKYIFLTPYGKPMKINAITKEIIELCNGENTYNDICKIIKKNYNVDYDLAKKNISELLKKFKICGILS